MLYLKLLICFKEPTQSTIFDVCVFAALMMSIKLNEHGLIQEVMEGISPSDGMYTHSLHHCLHSGVYYTAV